ncbi:rod shape-determining protein RodA [Aquisalimonas asiatica]|uniref:Peptidoglycan glycosyltransferase MrdB n=1 Tax=Aquisalimonas asiatica TaxID=406100 RepID=A0A1H8VD95_9GAMM|nr:rod shape-determining protein RodA [Aquisalimonas asiatica]SEP13147.1 cell elongation-specific peptidoglycan biosynthesis regulator RodA [Aquisalimonas asiatica]
MSELASQVSTRGRQSIMQRFLHLDVPLVTALLLLSLAGLATLYSATNQSMDAVHNQLIRMTLAFTAMVVMAQVPLNTLRRWTPWVFLGGLVMLVLVLLIGTTGQGAQRWLNLGLFRFQPAELMKLAIPMAVAWYLSMRALPPTLPQVLLATVAIVVPTALIVLQPDLGTSLLVSASGFFVLFLAGLRWRLMLTVLVAIVALVPVFWMFLMREYQKQRVLTLFDPERDPLGTGYHIIQSTIAIGSGGIYGRGWLNGTQSQLEFLPERHTDFIFAVFAEEFGLLGVALLLALYLFIIGRGMYIAINAQDTFSRLVAGSLTLTFFVYVFVNMGMVSGLMPVVGLPLPLVSYGGTSMVTMMAGFGILMSIHTHRKMWAS